ncbi:6-phosphofructokinase [Carboxydochorda subterranea]|uniref:6-phosphofructokinase n=1 Tax=Carboxydichorda subterranea TaxID=3109565 RepID=A0ABZ1BV42_9FIRM|nr:6-phosphofructokinase [Limnochorda sp. L945t]WRP16654.1 6-phosphofructokinase [Limnochorda sp. L945t]
MSRRIGVIVGGGESSGVHPFLWGLALHLRGLGDELWGVDGGWEGLAEGALRPLSEEEMAPRLFQGGSMLRSGRAAPVPEAVLDQGLRRLDEARIDALVVAGDHASMAAASRMARMGIRVVGVPQTIANDVPGSESSIGYPSAVQRGVEVAGPLALEAWSEGRTVVIGTPAVSTGWLPLAIALDTFADAVVIPEAPVDLDVLAAAMKRRAPSSRRGVTVVAAEGAVPGGVRRLARGLEERLGRETAVHVLDDALTQAAPSERELMHAHLMARRTAEVIGAGRCGVVVGLLGGRLVEVPLERAARAPRSVTPEWLQFATQSGLVLPQAA